MKNCTISLCLNYSSERGYYYTVDSPTDDFGQIDYCKFKCKEFFELPKGISLNEDGSYFYDNKTKMSIPSYELITTKDNNPAIVIPADESYDNFTTLRFRHRRDKESV